MEEIDEDIMTMVLDKDMDGDVFSIDDFNRFIPSMSLALGLEKQNNSDSECQSQSSSTKR